MANFTLQDLTEHDRYLVTLFTLSFCATHGLWTQASRRSYAGMLRSLDLTPDHEGELVALLRGTRSPDPMLPRSFLDPRSRSLVVDRVAEVVISSRGYPPGAADEDLLADLEISLGVDRRCIDSALRATSERMKAQQSPPGQEPPTDATTACLIGLGLLGGVLGLASVYSLLKDNEVDEDALGAVAEGFMNAMGHIEVLNDALHHMGDCFGDFSADNDVLAHLSDILH